MKHIRPLPRRSCFADKTQVQYCVPYCQRKHGIFQVGPLCQLEERHGIDLGKGYKNELVCATFIDYITQEQRQGLAASLSRARFFGLQADGSTDVGNIEDEVFLAVYCDPRTADGCVHVRSKTFFRSDTLPEPTRKTCLSASRQDWITWVCLTGRKS